jgi:hypothetical protein
MTNLFLKIKYISRYITFNYTSRAYPSVRSSVVTSLFLKRAVGTKLDSYVLHSKINVNSKDCYIQSRSCCCFSKTSFLYLGNYSVCHMHQFSKICYLSLARKQTNAMPKHKKVAIENVDTKLTRRGKQSRILLETKMVTT